MCLDSYDMLNLVDRAVLVDNSMFVVVAVVAVVDNNTDHSGKKKNHLKLYFNQMKNV